ncbi:MAG: glycosyltransferase family 2 protein [Methanobacterium sp.]
MNPKVSIIILNWNKWKDTIECLESLYQINYINYQLIVVDNGSEDESIKKIKDYCNGKIEIKSKFIQNNMLNKPIEIFKFSRENLQMKLNESQINKIENYPANKKLIIIKNEKNYGFSKGNNIAIDFTLLNFDHDYILLLNNDTTVDKNFLNELIKVLDSEDSIGIAGPTIYFYDDPTKIQSAGAMVNWKRGRTTLLKNGEVNDLGNVEEVEFVSGCALIVKNEVFNKIGFLNESYFAYWEETDFCQRASQAGYKILCIPRAKIWHKISTTTNQISGFYAYYMTRNSIWFMRKYANTNQLLYFSLYFISIELWLRFGYFMKNERNINVFLQFLRGIVDGFIKFD